MAREGTCGVSLPSLTSIGRTVKSIFSKLYINATAEIGHGIAEYEHLSFYRSILLWKQFPLAYLTLHCSTANSVCVCVCDLRVDLDS